MIGPFWAVRTAPSDGRRNVLGAFGLRFAFRFSSAVVETLWRAMVPVCAHAFQPTEAGI